MDDSVTRIEQAGVGGRTGQVFEHGLEKIKRGLLDEALAAIQHEPLLGDRDGVGFAAQGEGDALAQLDDAEVEVLIDHSANFSLGDRGLGRIFESGDDLQNARIVAETPLAWGGQLLADNDQLFQAGDFVLEEDIGLDGVRFQVGKRVRVKDLIAGWEKLAERIFDLGNQH